MLAMSAWLDATPSPTASAEAPARRGAPRKLFFPLIAQWHQAFHALPIAAALSRRPGLEVHVGVATEACLPRARELAARLGGRDIAFQVMWPRAMRADRLPPKVLMLARMAPRLRDFAAVVAPERTSLLLRRMGVTRPLYVHTDHGAGDRAVGYEPRIRRFDCVLVAGAKQEERMLRAGLIEPGRYAIVGYPKFEAVTAAGQGAPPTFDRLRTTVLYNPHFKRGLGSWPGFGLQVLAAFAAQDRYNLIFAPHVRLAAEAGERLRRAVEPYAAAPNIHVDLGGDRCCDMTYTDLAHVYLGDVSSQVYEFICRPRPCLFLNAQGEDRSADENYAHWALGPVLTSAESIVREVDRARRSHDCYRPIQVEAAAQTFDIGDRSSSERAADAVEMMLDRGRIESAVPAGVRTSAGVVRREDAPAVLAL
jgi:hypothetical protein